MLQILLAPARKVAGTPWLPVICRAGRAVNPTVDALADQAIVKVIFLVDHTWC